MKLKLLCLTLVASLATVSANCGSDDDGLLLLLAAAGLGGPGETPAEVATTDTPANEPVDMTPPPAIVQPGVGINDNGASQNNGAAANTDNSDNASGSNGNGSNGNGASGDNGAVGDSSNSSAGGGDSAANNGQSDSNGNANAGANGSGGENNSGGANGAPADEEIDRSPIVATPDQTTDGEDLSQIENADELIASDEEEAEDDFAPDVIEDKGNGNAQNEACHKRRIELVPEGKWYTRSVNNRTALHTYWANQKLVLRITDNCQAGWAKLRLRVRNVDGPKPDFYNYFHVTVANNRTGENAGAMLIRASDNGWRVGRVALELPQGDSEFALNWTNDAYKAGEYDANIQIGAVKLQTLKNPPKHTSLKKDGLAACYTNGRFFHDTDGSIYTFWANQTAGFCFDKLPAGKYEVTIEAKNYGSLPLPNNYKEYQVLAGADGVTATIKIKADANKYEDGKTILDLTGGDTILTLSWQNDAYKEGVHDANIQIRSVTLKRVGASERSPLAAYIRAAGNRGMFVLAGVSILALAGLLGVYAMRKRRASLDA